MSDESQLPAAIRNLITTESLPDLGPGPRGGVESVRALQGRIDEAVRSAGLSGEASELVRATVLLWHDHFDPAHAIAQDIENQDGSYVHAILHRREPDYSNAKYWFRRVGQHPCDAELARRAERILSQAGQTGLRSALLRSGQWDAFGFVDACEAAAGKTAADPQVQCLREIQRAEFEILLGHLGAGMTA